MDFSVGDKVLFKREKLDGKVIKINSPYKVRILSSDGFEMNVSVKDLVKIEAGTNTFSSYGDSFYSKDHDKKVRNVDKKPKSQSVVKIDLHIELLQSHYEHLNNFEIVQLQLEECYSQIERALNTNISKLEIIHGIGEGVLRREVHKILKHYKLRYYLSRDGGSTEVFI